MIADSGFEIENDLPPGVSLNIPPFLGEQAQFSKEDEIKTRRIAKHRIHVERAIQRIKSFRILKHDLQISMASDLNKIWVICSYLTLFFRPLIQLHEELILCYQGCRELGGSPGQIFLGAPISKFFPEKFFSDNNPPLPRRQLF